MTSNLLASNTFRRQYRKLHERLIHLPENERIRQAQDRLSVLNKKATTLTEYRNYLVYQQDPGNALLKNYYVNTVTLRGQVPLLRSLKLKSKLKALKVYETFGNML